MQKNKNPFLLCIKRIFLHFLREKNSDIPESIQHRRRNARDYANGNSVFLNAASLTHFFICSPHRTVFAFYLPLYISLFPCYILYHMQQKTNQEANAPQDQQSVFSRKPFRWCRKLNLFFPISSLHQPFRKTVRNRNCKKALPEYSNRYLERKTQPKRQHHPDRFSPPMPKLSTENLLNANGRSGDNSRQKIPFHKKYHLQLPHLSTYFCRSINACNSSISFSSSFFP